MEQTEISYSEDAPSFAFSPFQITSDQNRDHLGHHLSRQSVSNLGVGIINNSNSG